MGDQMWIFLTAVFLVLVFFLYHHPRTTLKVAGATLILIVAGVGIFIYYASTPQSTYIDRDSLVTVSVSYDSTACSDAFPLRVTIRNGADKTLEKIEWQMAAYVPGRSSDISEYQLNPYMSDRILEPKQMISLCYKVPKLREAQEASRLRWEARYPRISFRY